MTSSSDGAQLNVCRRVGVAPSPLAPLDRVGVAKNFGTELWPLNGLRHPVHGNMCGWYLWRGEKFSRASDWFEPICYQHLANDDDPSLPYLFLPQGIRFLIAPGYEDIWYDPNILDMSK
jgi:hypothetical protein